MRWKGSSLLQFLMTCISTCLDGSHCLPQVSTVVLMWCTDPAETRHEKVYAPLTLEELLNHERTSY
jgi:hypothetical protein